MVVEDSGGSVLKERAYENILGSIWKTSIRCLLRLEVKAHKSFTDSDAFSIPQ